MVRRWEVFEVGPGDVRGELHVTLSRKGEILIGAAAYDKWGKPEAAVLMFDRLHSLIGVVPADKGLGHAYPLVARPNGRHRVVQAHRFCRHYGIKVDRTVAFNEPEIDKEGVLVLDVAATRRVGRPSS